MSQYILRRFFACIPVLLGLSIFAFLIIHLVPGDPVSIMFSETSISTEALEQKRESLGLNDPLPVQYGRFLWGALHADLGRSIVSRRPVLESILVQLPATIELTVASLALAMFLGILLGTIAALQADSLVDSAIMVVALLGVSVPVFWSGLLMILVFSLRLGWLPAIGSGTLKQLVMPATLLGLVHGGVIARVMRSSMLDVLTQDYIRTARAKGLRERVVIFRHGLKNALIPTITVGGLQLGSLLNGAVIVEAVFARQGIGALAMWGIVQKDYPIVQGIVLFSGIVFVLANIAVDVLYFFLDPRIRYG